MNTTNTEKNLTLSYSMIQSFFWMNFAAIMGFSSIYLLSCGITNTQIGMIIAAAGIISAILQPVVASYADRPSSASLRRIVAVICLIILSVNACILLLYHRSVVLTGLLYGCSITLLQLMLPLVNSLGTESMNQGRKLNWGIARGMGSLVYAIIAYLLGIIVENTTARSVPVSIVIGFILMFVSVVTFPFRKTSSDAAAAPEKTGSSGSGSPAAFFRKYRRFSMVLSGTTLVYISHILLNNFTFQIVQSKGGGSPEMGFSMALAACIELPTLFLFSRMVKKVRCDIWFRLCGIFFALKAIGTLLAPNIPGFYGVQFLQMLGWALMTVASVYYVNAIMEKEDAIKGQAYMTMTYTFGSVLGALIGGWLIDAAGVNAMLIFASACAVIGAVIMLILSEKTPQNG